MASQISHIVYAKKYLEGDHPSWINRDEFFLGCVFPDIRRIDEKISRKDTHMYFEKIDLDFSGLTSFEAGWKFHLYCDFRREEILNNNEFFKLDGTDGLWDIPNKLLEDKLIYEKYNNWEKVCHLMNNASYVPNDINVSRETFEHWYAINANYIKDMPSQKSMHIFICKMLGLAPRADEIIKRVENLEKNEKAVEILSNLWKEII